MKHLLFLLTAFLIVPAARAVKVTGTVTDDKGVILPYASVFIKGTNAGTTANNSGRYFLNLPPGTYNIVCQYIGYARQEKTITLAAEPVTLNFQLQLQQTSMKEIVVKAGAEDPAYEIIRHAIKKRKSYEDPLDSFTCEAYIKALLKTTNLPAKVLGKSFKDQDRRDLGVDSAGKGIIYLSESLTRVSFKKPDRIKLEVISGRESGTKGFGFNFPTFVNFYNNNVNIFITQLSPRGYVSPIAEGALNYYRYKFLGSFLEDGKEINQIRVIPKRRFEPLFSGTINITDGDWRIYSLDLTLTKDYQLEFVDTFNIRQLQVPISPAVWRTQNQVVHISFNKFGINATGNILNVYSKYDPGPKFRKKYFNNVVVQYDTAVNKKTMAYWDSLRPVPLEAEEMADYRYKDSLYQASHSPEFIRHRNDSLRKTEGRFSPLNILITGVKRSDYDSLRPLSVTIQPLLPKLEYNTVEGLALNAELNFRKEDLNAGNNIEFIPHIRYGFSNTRLNAWGTLNINRKKAVFDMSGGSASKQVWSFSGGKRISQFNSDNPISPLINEIYTLIGRENYLKIYENVFGSIQYKTRFDNGLRISGSLLYEDRNPLQNSSNFSFFGSKDKLFTPNYPYEKLNAPFPRHQAVIAGLELQFKPGQRYIEFPDNKLAIGSKYPTLALAYKKGIPDVFGSDLDYDKWQFSIWDELNLKLRGILKYRFAIGGFLNTRKLFIQDFQHFNGNQTFYASEYVNSFQLAPYYANSSTAAFYATGHIEEHFNGMISNKIPLLRNLQWNLVAGANAFYVNRCNNYVEIFGGLENILKIFRVDVVASYLNGKTGQVGVRLGLDGLFGGFFNAALRNPGGRPPQRQ